jgi:uncharacterized protein (DUF305 family)
VAIVLAVILAVTAGYFALTGCERTVSVQNGVRVVCTYGHTVSDTVKTIEVPASQASNYSVQTKQIVCPEHQQAEKLYREAQAALAKADLKAAAAALKKVVALDAGFRQAKEQLAQIEAGKKPAPDTNASGSSSSATDTAGGTGEKPGTKPGTPGDDGDPEGPVASLRKWLPDDITGYSAEPLVADAFTITRNYAPDGGPKTKQLIIAAEQLADAKAVDRAIEANVRLLYTTDARNLTVGGKKAYIGTNGRGTAVLAISDGPVLVLLQLSDDGGAKALAGELVKIAGTLPR